MEPEPVVTASTPETVVTTTEGSHTFTIPVTPAPQAEKTVPYERFKEVLEENKALKSQPAPQASTKLNVDDIIAINASLEGLSQREKEKLAEEHKLTGKPLNEIRNSEDFLLWQTGYNQKVEKERALKPSNTQPEADKPRSLAEKLASASLEEKERLLEESGHWRSPRPKADRQSIGLR